MRKSRFVIGAFVGAAALASLVAACEEEGPPKKAVSVDTPAPVPPALEVAPAKTPAPLPKVAAPKNVAPVKPSAYSDDGSVDEILGKARDALLKGELSRALKLARLATKKAPNRSAAFNTLGRVQLARGERSDAIASFEKAVALNPSSSYAQNNLGLARLYDGRFEGAVDALEEATQLTPVEPYMWNNLGMAYEHLDRLDEARDAYRQAITASDDEAGSGNLAEQNLSRLAGVKTIKTVKTAKNDRVKSDAVPVDEVPVSDGLSASPDMH